MLNHLNPSIKLIRITFPNQGFVNTLSLFLSISKNRHKLLYNQY